MNEFLEVMSAMYDPSRVQFIKFLLQEGRTCVCEFEVSFKMVQSRVSRHLKILKSAGFIEVDRAGVWAYYYLALKGELQKSLIAEIEKLQIELPKKVCVCDIKKVEEIV